MDTLDDDDIDNFLSRPLGMEEEKPRRKFPLRPLLIVLAVAILGGGLGTAGYFASRMDTRDLIGILDVADQPKLAIQMPGHSKGKDQPAAPAAEDGMLKPPAPAGGEAPVAPPAAEAPPVDMAAETPPPPGLTPPPAPQQPSVPPAHEAPSASMVPPVTIDTKPVAAVAAAPETPAAPPPIVVKQEAPQGPLQPLPRPIDKPPSFANLPTPNAKPKPLGAVPAEGMTRHSGFGPLPVIASDGRQSWQVYARPFEGKDTTKPRLAVVVTGLGLDREATDAAIDRLPADVTLAFSPYAGSLDTWVKKARDAGHEVLLTLPVEESGYPARDPGPWGLTTSARPEDNADRLLRVLARTAGYVGVLAQDGPFTKSQQLGPILAMLRERGLLVVGNTDSADPKPPMVRLGGAVDSEIFRDAVESKQKALAAQVRAKGSQAVLFSPRPASMETMAPWLASLAAEGIVLAPVSALVGPQGGKS